MEVDWDQLNWNSDTAWSVMLVSSLPKLGTESRLYKIVQDRHPEAQITRYSTVEYTIEYLLLSEVSSALWILLSSKVAKTALWDSSIPSVVWQSLTKVKSLSVAIIFLIYKQSADIEMDCLSMRERERNDQVRLA